MPKPNAKGKAALLIIAGVICVILGFVGGQLAMALQTLPGDAQDPVVTQSYVETKVGEALAALTTRVDELEAELATLKSGTTPGGTAAPSGTNPGGTTAPSGTQANQKTVKINSQTVNVRSGPSTDSARVTQLSLGDVVTVLRDEGEWYYIQIGNTTGYVAKYLTISN